MVSKKNEIFTLSAIYDDKRNIVLEQNYADYNS